MKRLYIGVVALLVVASAALWACGGSDDNNNDNNSNTPTESASTTPENTQESSDTPSLSDGNTSADFQDLIDKVKLKEAKVAYDFSFSGGGSDTSGSFTLYSKPPDKARFDVNSGDGNFTIISSGGNTYYCDSSSSTCINSPVGAGSFPFIALFQNPDQLASYAGVSTSDLKHSTKTVAGQDADCYGGSAEGGTGEVCFSNDGILLSIHGGSGGTTTSIEATSVEGSVSDSDLEPPYPVQSIPGQ